MRTVETYSRDHGLINRSAGSSGIPGDNFVEAVEKTNPFSGDQVTARIEYHLTLDAGKHIAMMSGAEKGHRMECLDRLFLELADNLAVPHIG